jgi:hypothetical protein
MTMTIFVLTLALWLGVDLVASAAASSEIADAQDVLSNLSKFDKLYVSYQNCVWSAYNEGCGVEGDDGENGNLWYLGLTECYRANVAYTLYGVLKGAEDKGCSKATFLNSFFTTSGIEYFTSSMAAAGVAFTEYDDEQKITSECSVVEAEDGEDNNNDYTTNNLKIYSGDTSYGVGCVNKAFAMKSFQGRYCDERSEPVVTDSLKTFNSEIKLAQCVVVYDATNNNQDEDGNNNGGEENNDALNILTYSEACNTLNFPDGCPDPYGKLKANARSSAHASAVEEHPRREKAKTVMSWILLIFGVILLVASAWAYYRKSMAAREVEPVQTKKKGMFHGSLKTSSSKLSTKSDGSSVNRKKLGFWGKLRRGKS